MVVDKDIEDAIRKPFRRKNMRVLPGITVFQDQDDERAAWLSISDLKQMADSDEIKCNPYRLSIIHTHTDVLTHPLSHHVQQFLENGFCVLPWDRFGLRVEEVERCIQVVHGHYVAVMHTLNQLDLHDVLESQGFKTFKIRSKGRYDMVVQPLLSDPTFRFLQIPSASFSPIVHMLLGHGCHALPTQSGCMFSTPDMSENQPWHTDGPHRSDTEHLPPDNLVVFIPLVDMTLELGPTQFIPQSHVFRDLQEKDGTVAPLLRAGQMVLMDYRVVHRGLKNTSKHDRPLLYLTFGRQGWSDKENFSSRRYASLPTLIAPIDRDTRMNARAARSHK